MEVIDRAAVDSKTVTFLAGESTERVTWAQLCEEGRAVAAALQTRGLQPGGSVAIMSLALRQSVTAAIGSWLSGASVTFVPTPARTMNLETYLAITRTRLERLGISLLLIGSPWEEAISSFRQGRVTVERLEQVIHEAYVLSPQQVDNYEVPVVRLEDTAVLQLTSGTTSRPRAVRVSHANLAANIAAIMSATGGETGPRRMLSWLPLFHDMGLVGGLMLPMARSNCDLVLFSPQDYLARPMTWLQHVSFYKATSTAAPASAYALAARLLPRTPRLDLSTVRLALCGGDMIAPEVMDSFIAAAKPHGFDPCALTPAYGLAEATLAVTMSPFGRGPRSDDVDAEILEQRGRAVPIKDMAVTQESRATSYLDMRCPRVHRLSMLGRPVDGTDVRIVDESTGSVIADRTVGHVEVRGLSVAEPFRADVVDQAAGRTTAGWFRTGDIGYLVEGELVLTGRAKDIIILGGRNIYPDDVEQAAEDVADVRSGNSVAFAIRSSDRHAEEGLAVAVESRSTDHDRLRAEITASVQARLGVSPRAVFVLEPGSIPKTSSGKVQRQLTARRLTS
ncbi:AMP-binding protein [Frankia gtarii]|uniref:AMP-binding protein n=1 Tax=Frankia gtarii TaxID=2950102 RepID=UPI0021BED053|nr:AMP-binding protein [Frankia gtarii]